MSVFTTAVKKRLCSFHQSHWFSFLPASKGEVYYTHICIQQGHGTRGGLCGLQVGICLPCILLNENHFKYRRNMFSFPHRTEKEQGSGKEEASMHKDVLVFLI